MNAPHEHVPAAGERITSERAAAPSSPWIQSPLWDALWIYSGLWAPALTMLAYFTLSLVSDSPGKIDTPGIDVQDIALIYLPLSVLHRITTTYTVLGTPILRDDIRARPARYLYIPSAIVGGCIALSLGFTFHTVFDFMPGLHGRMWAFFVLAHVMILWERWHFCAQEFGVLSIYRIRARQFSPADKRFDRLYTVVLMLGVNMVLYVRFGFSDERILLHGTPLADASGPWLELAGHAAFAVGMAATAVALVRELRHTQRSSPKVWFYVLIGSHTALLYIFPKALGLFFLGYVVHHWMVSVGLFGRVMLRSYDSPSLVSGLSRLVLRVGPWLALAVLFYLFFEPLDRAGNLALPKLTMFAGASASAKVFAGVVIGVFFSLNFLHYYYDRCFFAFSKKAVRERVSPLVF